MDKQLSQCSDTDSEELLFTNMTKNRQANNKYSIQHTNRNEMFNNIIVLSDETKSSLDDGLGDLQPANSLADIVVLDHEEILVQQNKSMNISSDMEGEIKKIATEVSDLKDKMNEMMQIVISHYKKINLNLDKIHDTISQKELISNIEVTNGLTYERDLLKNLSLPLSSCEEINALEKEIRVNPELKVQLITFLFKIGGNSGCEEGVKVAYKIVDFMFKPDVLINYSWTGVSRGASGEKKPFQILEGILSIFFEVLLLADYRHTKQRNENIFRDGVLKHAKKRSLRKRSSKLVNKDMNDNTPIGHVAVDEAVVEEEVAADNQEANGPVFAE